MKFLFGFFFLLATSVYAFDSLGNVPVLYQGRVRPSLVYAKMWLSEIQNSESTNALELLWKINLIGHEPWDDTPLFWISHPELKERLLLQKDTDRFSYNQLMLGIRNPDFLKPILLFAFKQASQNSLEGKYELTSLAKGLWVISKDKKIILAQIPPNSPFSAIPKNSVLNDSEINNLDSLANESLKLIESLDKYANPNLAILPLKNSADWASINLLEGSESANFTAYSDVTFLELKQKYLAFKEAILSSENVHPTATDLAQLLISNYQTFLANTTQSEKAVFYPSLNKIYAENIYFKLPLAGLAALFFGLAAVLFAFANRLCRYLAFFCFCMGFIFLTSMLGLRSYILSRPPVSNMFETLIYVPWMIIVASLLLYFRNRQVALLLASSIAACGLLLVLTWSGLNGSLENIQPVLDSHYWLIMHVLLVVGSYGLFTLAAVLGHFYLFKRKNFLPQLILQSLYLGTFMLVAGTILGGVWAAESWGRFWDWDPKEAWAFISICGYLICIHAYKFKYIGDVGLALGAACGFLLITFTWYGVNYILGVGLHSYGFGNGGEWPYYLFLAGDFALLARLRRQ